MTQLTNLSPAASYGDLLTTTNNGQGLTTTLQNLQDGLGNNSPAQIATNAINFNRTGGRSFQLDGIPLTVSATILNQLGPSIASGILIPIQVYGMNETSIQVIPSFGANTLTVINKFVLYFARNGGTYIGGGPIFLQYSQGGAPASENLASGVITPDALFEDNSTVSSANGIIDSNQSGFMPLITAENSPICITNDTTPFEDGESNVRYYILYTVINL